MAWTIVRENRGTWTTDAALAFAGALITDPHLETKGLGIEVLTRFRRDFTPRLLPVWKQWLAKNHSANWATTDAICGCLIGPLLLAETSLVARMPSWSRDRNLWVRRASVVGLIPSVRKGLALDTAYAIARRLHADREDLIQKAVGWMLREAGKTDPVRLERYLRANGPKIPRTTLRYAIERFPPARRRALLAATKGGR
jgi:3-methyladenine DNA glycosylase AlkD